MTGKIALFFCALTASLFANSFACPDCPKVVRKFVETNQYDSALTYLEKAQEKNPRKDFALQKGIIFMKVQNLDSALYWFNRAAEKGDHAEPFRQRGALFALVGEEKKAFDDFTTALEIDPRNLAVREARSIVAMNRGETKIAAVDLDILLKKTKHSADLYARSAKAWHLSDSNEIALDRCRKAVSRDSTSGEYFNLLGSILFSLKSYEQALQSYEKVCALDPQRSEGFTGKGNCHVQLRQLPEAIRAYSTAIDLNGSIDEIYLLRAQAHAINGDNNAALDDFNQFIGEFPGSADGLIARAYHYLDTKWNDLAAADFTAALMIEPTNTNIHWALSWVHLLRRDFEAAQGIADEALSIDEKLWGVYANKGHARLLLNDFESAIKLYAVWLSHDPDVLSGKAKPADLLTRDFQALQQAGIHSMLYKKMVAEFISPIKQ